MTVLGSNSPSQNGRPKVCPAKQAARSGAFGGVVVNPCGDAPDGEHSRNVGHVAVRPRVGGGRLSGSLGESHS